MIRQQFLRLGGTLTLVVLVSGSSVSPADIVVDDFSSGEYHKAVAENTLDPIPGTMLGGHRRMYIIVTRNPFGQTANVDIVPRAGVMAVNTGIQSLVRVELRYGYGPGA